MNPQLIAACQMFLIPSTILFAALGVATTEGLKVLIAVMGIATSSIWFNRVRLWKDIESADRKTAKTLAGLFVIAWIGTCAVHAYFGYVGGFIGGNAVASPSTLKPAPLPPPSTVR